MLKVWSLDNKAVFVLFICIIIAFVQDDIDWTMAFTSKVVISVKESILI